MGTATGHASGDARPELILDSFVAGSGEGGDPRALLGLRAGMPLRLRRARTRSRGTRVEVLAGCGGRLGWLPWEDGQAILDPEAATAQVVALVPSAHRPRIQIRVALQHDPIGLHHPGRTLL